MNRDHDGKEQAMRVPDRISSPRNGWLALLPALAAVGLLGPTGTGMAEGDSTVGTAGTASASAFPHTRPDARVDTKRPGPSADRGEASAAGASDVTMMVGGYQVVGRFGALAGASRPVRAELSAPDGTPRALTEAEPTTDGTLEIAFTSRGLPPLVPVLLRPGDRVALWLTEDGAGPTVYTVGTLTATADADADRVSGAAPPGVDVTVTARSADGAAVRTVVSDASGRWVASFAEDLDLGGGSHGIALWGSVDGDDYTANQVQWLVRDVAVQVGAPELAFATRPGETVSAVVLGADGTPRGEHASVAWSETLSLRLRDATGESVPVLPGDRLEVTYGEGETFSATVPLIDAEVRPDSDDVVGHAPPGAMLTVAADGVQRAATTDADGAWSASFLGAVDVSEQTVARVRLVGLEWLEFAARAPRVDDVDPMEARVRLAGAAGAPASLVVYDHAGSARGRADGRVPAGGLPLELAVATADGSPLPWQSGDVATAEVGDVRWSFSAAPSRATADEAADTVSGETVPNATVTVEVGGTARVATADATGRWFVALAPEIDVVPGTEVDLTVAGPDAYVSHAAFRAFLASAQVGGTRVRVDGPPSLTVQIDVRRDGETVATAGCHVERTRCQVSLRDLSGSEVRLERGDVVTVTPDAGPPAELDIVPLTAHIDLSGRDVVGEAPPDDEVHISFAAAPGGTLPTLVPLGASSRTFRSGVYDYELHGSEKELLAPGLLAEVRYRQSNGHEIFAVAVVEVVRAAPGDPVVRGVAEPGSAVDAAYRSPTGTLLGDGRATAGDDGVFALELRTPSGDPAPVGQTGTLTVVHRRRSHEVVLTPLVVWRGGGDGAVFAVTAPRSLVAAIHHIDPLRGGDPWVVQGESGPEGVVELPGPGVDRSAVASIEFVVVLAGGDELRSPVRATDPPGRVYFPWSRP